jgi:hypothetical protein
MKMSSAPGPIWVDVRREEPWKPPVAMIVERAVTTYKGAIWFADIGAEDGRGFGSRCSNQLGDYGVVPDLRGRVLRDYGAGFGDEGFDVDGETDSDGHNAVEGGRDANALVAHPLYGVEMLGYECFLKCWVAKGNSRMR